MAVVFSINHDTSTVLTHATNYSSSSGDDISIGAAGAMCDTTNGLIVLVDDNTLDRGRKLATKSTLFRYRFYFDPNSITMADGDLFTIHQFFQDGGSYYITVDIRLGYSTGIGYRVFIRGYTDGDATSPLNANANITDEPHYIEVYAVQATTNISADGSYSWWLDGVAQTPVTGVDNYNLMFDYNFRFELGAVLADRDAGTTGTIYFDEIVANNDGGEIGPEPSSSVSPSVSPSSSVSPSLSPSASESPSISPSASESPSASVSPSISPSASVSPSESPSISPSASESPSASVSESISPSASVSPSESPSLSPSSSVSPSSSASPSAGAPIMGTVCWGHVTGVIETNVRTYTDNWTGTGTISGAGDAETLDLNAGEYMISETVNTGVRVIELDQNHYDAGGDSVNMDYRTGTTQALCEAAGWSDYTAPFMSEGYVQVKLTSTL